MEIDFEKIKDMTIEEFLKNFIEVISKELSLETNTQKIYKAIYNKNGVDYKSLLKLLPSLDEEEISMILRYDKDYKISFLLSIAEFADEDDLTKQAIYLLRRHNLNYILPLLPFIDEDRIRNEYLKSTKK